MTTLYRAITVSDTLYTWELGISQQARNTGSVSENALLRKAVKSKRLELKGS